MEMKKTWTPRDLDILSLNYPTKATEELLLLLPGKSKQAIHSKAVLLKLRKKEKRFSFCNDDIMKKIYVASSWRNKYQQRVVEILRGLGHEVYDFMNPPEGTGFHWSDIDPNWEQWTPQQWRSALKNPIARAGFESDFNGMIWADTCVMVLPCGRSANTEAGWMAGRGNPTHVYCPEQQEPELMYKIYDGILCSEEELIKEFRIKRCGDCGEFATCSLTSTGVDLDSEACAGFIPAPL